MSTFSVPVVRVGAVSRHPNADTLSLTEVRGCPVVLRTGSFAEGDLAVYVPVDAVVDTTVPELAFLAAEGKTSVRIRAKRLRGTFSMGLLVAAPADAAALADDVAAPDAPCTPCSGIFDHTPPVAEFLETAPHAAPDFPGLGTVADYVAAYADKPGAAETLRALAADDDAYALSYGAPPEKARYSAARAGLYRAAADALSAAELGAIDCAYHGAHADGLSLSQPGQPAPVVAPPSGGSLYTPPAEAGIPPPAQTAQPDKPVCLPESGALLVPWPKPKRATRARSSPSPGIRWRSVAPPPVESWRIPPAEAGAGCTPWRAKDTGRWRGSCSPANVAMHRAWRGILAPICGPPALPALQARHH